MSVSQTTRRAFVDAVRAHGAAFIPTYDATPFIERGEDLSIRDGDVKDDAALTQILVRFGADGLEYDVTDKGLWVYGSDAR